MDFLDPKKQRRHTILLIAGYITIGILIVLATIVLIYQAKGFGLNRKGEVVQDGLVFFSSAPNPANIYLNGQLNSAQTNARISVPAGSYKVKLTRTGYRDWTRTINVMGGDVQNFDYPMLFPAKLQTSSQATYSTAPGIASQSRDRRWLVVQQTATATTFDVYDLKAKQPVSTPITLPTTVVSSPTAAQQSWQAVAWANDATHLLLKHAYGTSTEYIVLDRSDPTKSVNLNKTLGTNPTDLTLIDNKYDQYYLLDASGQLSRATLSPLASTPVLQNVLSYKSYGSNEILYATSLGAATGRVNVMILNNNKSYFVRDVSAATTYVLDIAEYSGTPYVVLAASSDNTVYIYKDPLAQMSDASVKKPSALWALHVPNVNYVSFSPTARYIVGESGSSFKLYDIYLKLAYSYTLPTPLDTPQPHAAWMDGDRLTYVSAGKQYVFDYDSRNRQTLMPVNVAQGAFFDQSYRYVYEFTTDSNGVVQLDRTGLRTPADL